MSSSLIFLLFSTTILLFPIPSTSFFTSNICRQTKDPLFCSKVLGRGSDLSLPELEQRALAATIASARATSDKINSLLPQTNDPNLKVVYSLCSNYYSAALSALDVAIRNLKLRQYGDLNAAASIVSQDASSCEKAFSFAGMPAEKIPISGDNQIFDRLAEIFSIASRILSGS